MLHDLHSPAATDAASEAHRHAYNAAFDLLDLSWQWDRATFARTGACGRAGLRSWIETEQAHLLRAYGLDFLVEAIENTKARCLSADEQAARREPAGRRAQLAA